MQNFKAVLDGTNPYQSNQRGTVLLIQTADQGNALTVQLMRGGAIIDTVSGVGPAYKLVPVGGFDAFTISGAAGNVVGIITMGDIDIQLSQVAATIANAPANPVPVTLVNPGQDSGHPIDVTIVGGVNLTATNVGINNTPANAVPVTTAVSATVATVAPVVLAASATGTVVLAADATRRGARFYNAGANPIALTPDNTTTFAQAAVVLNPGDMWTENEAPAAAWFASTGAAGGSTLNVQTVKA